MSRFSRLWQRRALVALATALILAASAADARPGRGGFGLGSRGGRTFQAPPPTATAPRQAAPLQAAPTQPGQSAASAAFGRPGMAATQGGFFSRRGGLMGGLLGAGLVGMLLGYGFAGGLGGLGSILGLLLQVALIVLIARLAMQLFQRWRQPALAAAGGPAGAPSRAGPGMAGLGLGGLGAALRPRRRRDELGIGKADLDNFERLLGSVQTAYGNEDRNGLRAATTPEMASHLERELDENAARGLVNKVDNPRLLQGDLAESWREGNTDYATVAMRFGLSDYTVERATGRVVNGTPGRPVEATEVWTFARPRGGSWRLSAIQPT